MHENNSYCTDSRRDSVFRVYWVGCCSCRVQAVYIVRASCRPLIPSVGSSSCLQSSALCQRLVSALQALLRTLPPPLQTQPCRLRLFFLWNAANYTLLCSGLDLNVLIISGIGLPCARWGYPTGGSGGSPLGERVDRGPSPGNSL